MQQTMTGLSYQISTKSHPPPSIEEAKKIPNKITVFDQRFFLYFLNCENKNRWCGSVMFNYHYLQNHSPQDLRRIVVMCEALKHDRRFPYFFKTATEFIYLTRIKKMSIRITKNGGWHFTYIGNVKKISEKLHSFAHTELSTIANDEVSTEKMINAGINIFNGKKECHFVNIDKTFPVYLRRNIEKYIKFIKMNE